MELKKNPGSDLENLRSIFFMIGLVVALGAVYLVFNISSSPSEIDELVSYRQAGFESEEVPPTRYEPMPLLPPPPPPAPEIFNEISVLENEENLENELSPLDQDINPENEIDYNSFGTTDDVEDQEIFLVVEKMPAFPGGDLGLRRFIVMNIKYPPLAKEKKIEGMVYVKFCVTAKGAIDKVSIAKGVDPLLDQEAMRVISMLPPWTPGEQRGKKVPVWYTVPINFRLTN